MITVIYAHPYPLHSRANRALQAAIAGLPRVHVRDLYTLYPDFHIDVAAEQAKLAASDVIVLQHPMRWYHAPALLSLWLEKVLSYGWAYGHDDKGRDTRALQGKRLLWAVTVGGSEASYSPAGYNEHTIAEMSLPMRQTALYCGMQWLEPYVVHGTGQLGDAALDAAAQGYRARLSTLLETSS